MSYFENVFSSEFKYLEPKPIETTHVFGQNEKFLLIAGDFFGIQKFIFDGITTKNAAKILRAKSAYVQILTKVLAYYTIDRLGIGGECILSTAAGKFEILSPNLDLHAIEDIRAKINAKFVKDFYGMSGVGISFVECEKKDFEDKALYKKLRDALSEKVEYCKYSKFDLVNADPVLQYDEDITNQTLCRLCNVRKQTNNGNCQICDDFVSIGKELTTKQTLQISKNKGSYRIFEKYYVTFDATKDENTVEVFDISKDAKGANAWALGSYTHCGKHGEITTFEDLAKYSCMDRVAGVKAIGVLKGDIDGMGNFLKNSDATDSMQNFNTFSKSIDAFFSVHIPRVMRDKYPHSYTVFAGGDDLFLIGAWDEILELAIFIQKEFAKFIGSKLSISFGFLLAKENTPLNYLADTAEHLLELSKNIDENKNAITAFGESVKWSQYITVREKISKLLLSDIGVDELKTAFLYNLLTFCDMSKRVAEDIESAMWKSKLNYSFTRNMDKKHTALLKEIDETIEKHPREAKMVISEVIYKLRSAQ